MNNKLISVTVGLAVCIILAGSLLVPAMADATRSLEAETMDQPNALAYYSEVTSLNITQTGATSTYTINGVPTSLPSGKDLLISDSVLVQTVVVAQSVTTNPTLGISAKGANPVSLSNPQQDISITLEEGVITIIYGSSSTTLTFPVSKVFLWDPTGDYVSVNAAYTTAVHANESDEIYTFLMKGWWGDSTFMTEWIAAEGETTQTVTTATSDGTLGSKEVTVGFVTEDHDELLLDSISDSTLRVVAPGTYVTYEKNGASSLISVLPLLVIVAILVSAITLVSRKY